MFAIEYIDRLWIALQQVRHLEFVAHSEGETGWNGRGIGSVIIESPTTEVLVFQESGTWHPVAGRVVSFRNAYRWTRCKDTLRLEHLRFGEKHPVYLFDLAPDTDTTWSSIQPHLCREDEYTALLQLQDSSVLLNWKIIGPTKKEEIIYRYQYEALS